MPALVISKDAPREITEYLSQIGYDLWLIEGRGVLPPVSCHGDMFICTLGEGLTVFAREGELCPGYPQETAFNALIMNGCIFCRTDSASPRLMGAAKAAGLKPVAVKQGYAACSVCRVTEKAAITADRGMADALRREGVETLLISPGHILLPGYDTGFIGGASCLAGGRVVFFGDVTAHPDWEEMRLFIHRHGAEYKYFGGIPLTDLGGAVSVDGIEKIIASHPSFTLTKPL